MKTSEITTGYIFENGSTLTLEVAKTLIGKRIICTNPEYVHNSPVIRDIVVKEIACEWDLAAMENMPQSKYENRQAYWASYMTEKQVQERKDTLVMVSDKGQTYKCYLKSRWYKEPTFFGSDEDRQVYFVIAENFEV